MKIKNELKIKMCENKKNIKNSNGIHKKFAY